MAPIRPTQQQWTQLVGGFPALVQANVWITDGQTLTYNCIAYSLGFTDRWINPSSPLTAFQQQYAGYGYAVAPPATALIDGWGTSPTAQGGMKHGSRQSTSVAGQGLWESKLGQSWRITHGRNELTGQLYGGILTHFSRRSSAAEDEEAGMPDVDALGDDELARVGRLAAEVPDDLVSRFDERLAAWKATWTRPESLSSSDTYELAQGPEFDALVELGEATVPLIMRHLHEPDGFFLLPLLERVQTRPLASAPAHPLEGEQARALRTVRTWLSST